MTDFAHLRRLTDALGLHEHADGTTPRREHGYCVDDVARGLVLAVAEPDLADLREQYLCFVLAAQVPDGRFRNRRDALGRWTDRPTVEDCWGRALQGLGAASADPRALAAFERGAAWRSPHARATCFAGLGAADVLAGHPGHPEASALLGDAARRVGRAAAGWDWPEPRLTYANAVVPEVLLAAGAALADEALLRRGLDLLGWLLDAQTSGGHLSLVPVGGRGPGESGPGFDQQPIEAATLATACARAHRLTGDARWLDGLDRAVAWFAGDNDAGTPLHDAASGGGCDGLTETGRNTNQGAESTLALLSTRRLALSRA